MRDFWHELRGKWGLPDERLNTCTGTATDTHKQIRGLLPKVKMNSVTSLSHSGFSSLPPAFVYSTKWSGPEPFFTARANISSSYSPHSPSHPPHTPLHFRNGCWKYEQQKHTCFSPSAKGSERPTSNNNLKACFHYDACKLPPWKKFARLLAHSVGQPFSRALVAGKFPGMQRFHLAHFCWGSTWNCPTSAKNHARPRKTGNDTSVVRALFSIV